MPSATTKRFAPEYPESWLLERTFPVWEIATLEPSKTMPASGSQLEGRGAHLDGGAEREGDRRAGDALACDEGAVGGVEVLDRPGVAAQHQARMVAGRVVVADHES